MWWRRVGVGGRVAAWPDPAGSGRWSGDHAPVSMYLLSVSLPVQCKWYWSTASTNNTPTIRKLRLNWNVQLGGASVIFAYLRGVGTGHVTPGPNTHILAFWNCKFFSWNLIWFYFDVLHLQHCFHFFHWFQYCINWLLNHLSLPVRSVHSCVCSLLTLFSSQDLPSACSLAWFQLY